MGKTYWAASSHFVAGDWPLNCRSGSSGKNVSFRRFRSLCMPLLRGGGTTAWISTQCCGGGGGPKVLPPASIIVYCCCRRKMASLRSASWPLAFLLRYNPQSTDWKQRWEKWACFLKEKWGMWHKIMEKTRERERGCFRIWALSQWIIGEKCELWCDTPLFGFLFFTFWARE